jgi:5-formyltetrahydrofolate cyclo-ligase
MTDPCKTADKPQTRAALRRVLAGVAPADRAARSAAATALLTASNEFSAARVVMIFLSTAHEIDTTALALRCWHEGKTVVAPKVSWDQRRMLPVELSGLSDEKLTVTGPGLREPIGGNVMPVSMIDLVLVPGLGFSPRGSRIGRGMGFYDRFLRTPDFFGISCGFAYEEQVRDDIPVHEHDVPVMMLCTDRALRRFGTNCM